jgi:hypothetical protein
VRRKRISRRRSSSSSGVSGGGGIIYGTFARSDVEAIWLQTREPVVGHYQFMYNLLIAEDGNKLNPDRTLYNGTRSLPIRACVSGTKRKQDGSNYVRSIASLLSFTFFPL